MRKTVMSLGRSAQRGMALLIVGALMALLAIAGLAYLRSVDVRAKSVARDRAVIQAKESQANAEKVERERLADVERKSFDEKSRQEKQRSDFDKSFLALSAIYQRWKDAELLANSTSRIALSPQIAALQSVRRDAESLLLPECLTDPRQKMLSGMTHMIDGFIAFMRDAGIGKILAEAELKAAALDFSAYESGQAQCRALTASEK